MMKNAILFKFYIFFSRTEKLNRLRLVLEEILNSLVRYHLLIENVSTSLRALNHLDNLCICATIHVTFVEGSDRFLCHSLFKLIKLLNL